jgi:hypothetical protein
MPRQGEMDHRKTCDVRNNEAVNPKIGLRHLKEMINAFESKECWVLFQRNDEVSPFGGVHFARVAGGDCDHWHACEPGSAPLL